MIFKNAKAIIRSVFLKRSSIKVLQLLQSYLFFSEGFRTQDTSKTKSLLFMRSLLFGVIIGGDNPGMTGIN